MNLEKRYKVKKRISRYLYLANLKTNLILSSNSDYITGNRKRQAPHLFRRHSVKFFIISLCFCLSRPDNAIFVVRRTIEGVEL